MASIITVGAADSCQFGRHRDEVWLHASVGRYPCACHSTTASEGVHGHGQQIPEKRKGVTAAEDVAVKAGATGNALPTHSLCASFFHAVRV